MQSTPKLIGYIGYTVTWLFLLVFSGRKKATVTSG